jgi:hypothetical protein
MTRTAVAAARYLRRIRGARSPRVRNVSMREDARTAGKRWHEFQYVHV